MARREAHESGKSSGDGVQLAVGDGYPTVVRGEASNLASLGPRHGELERLYPVLRRLAGRFMRAERMNHTLQPTALVHEALLTMRRLQPTNDDRVALVALAARAMRLTLVDYARHHRAQRRRSPGRRLPLHDALLACEARSFDLLALDEAFEQLAEVDATLARIVELRFFGEMTIDETARALGVSRNTVKRGWSYARAWLYCRLRGDAAA